MIYFLYGPDTYRSRRKLAEITAAFREKAGDKANIVTVDAAEHPEAALRVGRTASLFTPKELIVIERAYAAPAEVTEHLSRQLSYWAADRNVTVVFWEEEIPPKRSSFAERLNAESLKTQEFPLLTPSAADRWLDQEANRLEITLAPEARRLLVSHCGADLWALSNELQKIRDGWSVAAPTRTAAGVWDFTDGFFVHRRRAFGALARLLDAGLDPLYLLASLGGALRTVALIWKGTTSGKIKILTVRLHPFVVRKNTPIANRMSAGTLRSQFQELISADEEMKTGRLPSPLPLIKLVLRRR